MVDDPSLLEFRRAAVRARYEHYAEQMRIRGRVIADVAFVGLKILPILSGGAILALFTLLGSQNFRPNRPWLITAFACFTLSLITWMVTVLLAYMAQNAIWHTEGKVAEMLFAEMVGAPPVKVEQAEFDRANRLLVGPIVVITLSILLFAGGAGAAFVSVLLGP